MGKLILILVGALAIGLVLAALYLPWWLSLGLMVGLLVAGKLVGGKVLEKLFLLPFKAKGAVLKGTTVEVHDISGAPVPSGEGLSEEMIAEEREKDWYFIDATFRPPPPKGEGFGLWEPGELVLVPLEAKSIPSQEESEDEHGVRELWVYRDGQFAPDEEYKYEGEQRLKLHVGVPKDTRELQFRYYFELFGRVEFPGS